MVAYTVTDTAINLVAGGRSFSVPRHSVNGTKLVEAIRNGASEAELINIADPTTYINTVGGGIVTVKNGAVFYDGAAVPECITRRLLDLLSNNLPIRHLVNFYSRLDKNPSKRAVNELYTFLEHKNIPITPDGTLLMYKAVRNDFLDKHSGKFSNKPGNVLSMKRNEVCDDADRGCSYGFHAGSLEYVKDFAANYGDPNGDRIVIVEVDPADVVSIPRDCNCQKVRTCKYKVLQEFQGALPEGGVRDTSNPYMDSYVEEEESDLDYCTECGDHVEDCSCDDVVMSQAEYEEALEEARREGRAGLKSELLDNL